MWVPALMLQTNFELFHKKFKSRSMIQFCHVLSEQEAQSTQFSLHGPKTAAFKERSCGPPKLSHSWHGSFGHHHLHKLLIVDLTVAIHIGFADHLIDFLISKLPQWNIRHKSQVRAIRMRFIAFPCLQRFALKLHVIGYIWIPCLFMNWYLLFDFLNLRIFQTYLIRTEKTSQQKHIWHGIMLWDQCISQAKNDPRKRMISENLDKPRKKQNGWILDLKAWKPGRSFSPRLVITWRNSAALMKPLPSRSKTLKASISSSSVSVSCKWWHFKSLQVFTLLTLVTLADSCRFKTWVWQPTYIPTSTHSKCDGR